MSEPGQPLTSAPEHNTPECSAPPDDSAPPEFLCRIDSPIGRLEVVSSGDAVTSLSIEKNGCLPHDHLAQNTNRLLTRCARQLTDYFAGTRRHFTIPVTLLGTDFQRCVWLRLMELGWGEVTSYGDIARASGRVLGGRAVGGAIRANPIPLIIPCHRVLASGGQITGYSQGAGIPTKVWLLDHEGAVHATRTTGRATFTTEEILGLPAHGLARDG